MSFLYARRKKQIAELSDIFQEDEGDVLNGVFLFRGVNRRELKQLTKKGTKNFTRNFLMGFDAPPLASRRKICAHGGASYIRIQALMDFTECLAPQA